MSALRARPGGLAALGAAAALSAAALAPPLLAQSEPRTTGSVTLGAEVDDNPRLEPDGEFSAGVTAAARFRRSDRAPTGGWTLTGGAAARAFAGPGADDEDGITDSPAALSPRLSLGVDGRGPRRSWSLTVSGSVAPSDLESTVTGPAPDPGAPGEDPFAPPERREVRDGFRANLGLSASWRERLDARRSLGLSASLNRLDFVDAPAGTPNTSASVSTRLDRVMTPRLSASADLALSGFAAEDVADTRSLTAALRAGGEWRASPRLTLSGLLGPSATRTETVVEESLTPGVSATLSADWRPTRRDAWSLSFDQGVEANDDGDAVNASRLSVRLRRELTPRLRAGLSVALGADVPLTEDAGEDRLFASASPRLDWSLTPETSLGVGYRLRLEEDGETAASHNLFLSLTRAFGR